MIIESTVVASVQATIDALPQPHRTQVLGVVAELEALLRRENEAAILAIALVGSRLLADATTGH